MKKSPKSLFQVASEKYTSISSELKETKKIFFEQLKVAAPMTATDLNKAYSGKEAARTPPTPVFSSFGASNPGGNEKPTPVVQPAPVATAPGQQGQAPAFSPSPVTGIASTAGPTQQQIFLLTNPAAKKTPLPDGRILIEDPKNPDLYIIQSAEDAKRAGTAIRESVKATIYTVEDIMSALTTLSTGAVSEVDSVSNECGMSEEEEGTVNNIKPAGDTLVDEEEEETNSNDGLNTTDEADDGPNVDQSGELQASGSETGPEKVTGTTDSSWSGLGGVKAPEVEGSKTEKEIVPDDKTGVDPSYTQEDEQGKDFATGAGEAKPETVTANSAEPEIGESEDETELNPSGKKSAFWLPNDDLLGLKDIVKDVSKSHGVPDAQETIGKDASGNLVKKPTMPAHSMPNMKQYVRTNPPPGIPGNMPSVIPQGGQPVDISDLDGVMGMDTKDDRALNISLNFNF